MGYCASGRRRGESGGKGKGGSLVEGGRLRLGKRIDGTLIAPLDPAAATCISPPVHTVHPLVSTTEWTASRQGPDGTPLRLAPPHPQALCHLSLRPRPGWRITAMYIAASNFGAAPTGASTITRFLQQPAARGTQHKRQRTAGDHEQHQPPPETQAAATEAVSLQPPRPGPGPPATRPTTSAVSGSLSVAEHTLASDRAGADAGGPQLTVVPGVRVADPGGTDGGSLSTALRRSPSAEPPFPNRGTPAATGATPATSSARSSGSAGRVDGGGNGGGRSRGGAAQLQQQRSQGRGKGRGARARSPSLGRGGAFVDLRSLLLAGGAPGRRQQQQQHAVEPPEVAQPPQDTLRASRAGTHGAASAEQGAQDEDEDSDSVEVVEVQGPGAQRSPPHPDSCAGASPAPSPAQHAGTRAGRGEVGMNAPAPAGSVQAHGEPHLPPPPAAAGAAAATAAAAAVALDSQERPASLEPAIATLEDWLGDPSAAEPLWLGPPQGDEVDPAPHQQRQHEQQEQDQEQHHLRPALWLTGLGPACGTGEGLQRPGGAARSNVCSLAAVGTGMAGTGRQAQGHGHGGHSTAGVPLGAMAPAAVQGSPAPRAVAAKEGPAVGPGCAVDPAASSPRLPPGAHALATGGVPGGGLAAGCAEVAAEVDEQVLAELPRHIQEVGKEPWHSVCGVVVLHARTAWDVLQEWTGALWTTVLRLCWWPIALGLGCCTRVGALCLCLSYVRLLLAQEVRRSIWAAGGSLRSGPRDPGRGDKPDRRTAGAKRARDNQQQQQQQQQLDIRRFAGK